MALSYWLPDSMSSASAAELDPYPDEFLLPWNMSQNIIHLTTEDLAHFQVSFDSLADTGSHPPSDDETEQTTAAAHTSAPTVSRNSNLAFAPPAFESRFP